MLRTRSLVTYATTALGMFVLPSVGQAYSRAGEPADRAIVNITVSVRPPAPDGRSMQSTTELPIASGAKVNILHRRYANVQSRYVIIVPE
jgi:hypothetical protein